jgi:O-antigen/teichoic acid export membrane protein
MMSYQVPSLPGLWAAVNGRVFARKFVRDVGLLTVANFASAAISLVQGVLIARWLGPESYGVAALLMSYPDLVYTFFDARSSDASVKYLGEFHTRGEREQALAVCKIGYLVDLAMAGIAFGVVLATAFWVAENIAHAPDSAWLVLLYSAALVPRAFVGTSYAVLVTLGHFSRMALLDTAMTVLRTALVLGLVLAGWQVAGVIWGNAIALMVTGAWYGLVGYVVARRTWGGSWHHARWSVLKGYRRAILRFLAHNELNALLGMIPKQLDTVLLGYFRNPLEVGYYRLAKSLANVVSYLVGPLQSVTYPELARLWGAGDREGFCRRLGHLTWQVGVPLALGVLIGVAFVPSLLTRLVGEAYRPAIPATQILLVGSAIWLALFCLRPTYFVADRITRWMVGNALYSAAFLVLSVLTVNRWGYLGMAGSLTAVTAMFHVGMGLGSYEATKHQGKSQ